MPIVNGTSISWGNLWQGPVRAQRPAASSTPAASRPGIPFQPVSGETRAEAILGPAAAVVAESAGLPSLVNLYAHAQIVNAPDQHGTLITLAPEGVEPAKLPDAAARTSAEIMARTAYALVASVTNSRGDPARLSRQG